MNPAALDAGTDTARCRATMIGAMFAGNFDKVPRTDIGRILWEVPF